MADLLDEIRRAAELIRNAPRGTPPEVIAARAAELHDPASCPCTIGAHDALLVTAREQVDAERHAAGLDAAPAPDLGIVHDRTLD